MSTKPMTPYTKEPGYIYIETDEDRAKYMPKLTTDEFISSDGEWCEVINDNKQFSLLDIYRRRIPSPVVGEWLPITDDVELTGDVYVELYYPVNMRGFVYDGQYIRLSGHEDATHYRIIPKVAPPQPEPVQDDTTVTDAYYAWVSGTTCYSDEPIDVWAAAVKWERERVGNDMEPGCA